MNAKWYMMTLVGRDQPGIVAKTTTVLYEVGCNLGEASMMRLGGNFTIMLMVRSSMARDDLQNKIDPVITAYNLRCHFDEIEGQLHDHRVPDVRITVYGADRAGIVSQVTTVLADAGLDILDLESDVGGTDAKPFYIMHIEGHAGNGIEALQQALDEHISDDIDVSLNAIDTMIG